MKQDKVRALRDLCDLNYSYGYHCGRWTDDNQMDDSAEEFLAIMVTFAEEYDIEYDKNLSHYIQDAEYEATCYRMDEMGYQIYEKVKSKLVDIITNGEVKYE